MPRYEISWTDVTSYRRVFDLPEPVDLDDLNDVHEALDTTDAWDQVNWASDLVEVSERNVDDARDMGNGTDG